MEVAFDCMNFCFFLFGQMSYSGRVGPENRAEEEGSVWLTSF